MSAVTKSATELIVEAMENADDMETVIVVYRLRSASGGFGWVSNTSDTIERIGMLETAKQGMWASAYLPEDPRDEK